MLFIRGTLHPHIILQAIINMKYGIAQTGKATGGVSSGDDSDAVKERVGKNATTISGNEVQIEYLELDLASFESTRDCAKLFTEKDLPLHILVNNAGICAPPHSMVIVY